MFPIFISKMHHNKVYAAFEIVCRDRIVGIFDGFVEFLPGRLGHLVYCLFGGCENGSVVPFDAGAIIVLLGNVGEPCSEYHVLKRLCRRVAMFWAEIVNGMIVFDFMAVLRHAFWMCEGTVDRI